MGENCNSPDSQVLFILIIVVIVRRLGELELKLAEYDRGYGHGFASGLGESKSGLGESTLFNETLISRV